MSTISYSNVDTIQKQKEYLNRKLDKYAKFYWRGEDMWETYSTFITNNGSALKFVNGPSFSNEYSSPQYDHAMGNLTGVKFTRMQVSFTICTYGVTAEEYRSLIAALGPYEIDYLSFAYDDKLCYLVKTTGMKEGQKTVIGVKDGKDLYMVENTITFEVQGEQCALAQRQYIWTTPTTPSIIHTTDSEENDIYQVELSLDDIASDMLSQSELPFSIVSEISIKNDIQGREGQIQLYITTSEEVDDDDDDDNWDLLCQINFNKITKNWQNTPVNVNTSIVNSIQDIDKSFSLKYDSTSGLVFMQYGESDYKILDLLLTNTYGEYLINKMITTKMKIDKYEDPRNIRFIWKLINFEFECKEIVNSQLRLSGENSNVKFSKYQHGDTVVELGNGGWRSIDGARAVNYEDASDGIVLLDEGYMLIPVQTKENLIIWGDGWYQLDNMTDTEITEDSATILAEDIPTVSDPSIVKKGTVMIYGRAKAILV